MICNDVPSMFMSALHESPNDEVTWLALADWLEEDSQTDRAELVRIVRRLRTFPVMIRGKEKAALEDRVAALLQSGVRPVVPEFVNDLGMRFALIPPGRFRMGSPVNDKERRQNERAHEVELTRPFYLGVYPVTQAEYLAVMGVNPSWYSRDGAGKEEVKGISDEELARFPVECVSWEDAQAFLQKLNERAKGKDWKYRLPSEAEWEYSCRGGASSSTAFHFGASLSSHQANFNGEYPSSKEEKGPNLVRPSAVGTYASNALGLHDMHGNVWEWCQDWYGEYESSAVTDPLGSAHGSDRVSRGGSWYFCGDFCQAANRNWNAPSNRLNDMGFRVAAVSQDMIS